MKKIALLPIFFIFLIWSCQPEKDISPVDPAYSIADEEEKGMIKIGRKLENPYSVENMLKAYKNLRDSKENGKISDKSIDIAATHLYIKFKPENEEELDILRSDSTLILFSYPLDYDIELTGNYYHDPEVPYGQPTYQYCSVPVDKILPSKVDYEILDELYIPDDYSDVNDQSARKELLTEYLVEEALRITGNLSGKPSKNSDLLGLRSSWRPAGRISLQDNDLNGIVGVGGIAVRATRWFTTHIGYTSSNGYFSCNGTFKRDANYSISWDRYDYDIRSGSLGKAVLDGPKKTGDWNITLAPESTQWMYALVHQAAHDYYYGNRLGLKAPPQNSFWKSSMKISVWNEGNDDANGSHCKDCRFLGISSRIRIWKNTSKSSEIYATTLHELAHASHWELRKNNWLATEDRIIESWARGVQWALGRLRYPNYRGGSTILPLYTQIVVDMIDGSADYTNNGSSIFSKDNVTGYTIKNIEDVLSNTTNWNDWHNNIKNSYENNTENNLQTLFNHWGN